MCRLDMCALGCRPVTAKNHQLLKNLLTCLPESSLNVRQSVSLYTEVVSCPYVSRERTRRRVVSWYVALLQASGMVQMRYSLFWGVAQHRLVGDRRFGDNVSVHPSRFKLDP
jgi:hypothetical protein